MLRNDTYWKIARSYYAHLTDIYSLTKFNRYVPTQIPTGAIVKVTVNCSCGNMSVSEKYGLFETYPLQSGENASSVASKYNISAELLQKYNPGVSFSSGAILYIPTRGENPYCTFSFSYFFY
jgi:chitin elicitor receptor kinase 1